MTVLDLLPLLEKLNYDEKIQAMQYLLSELAHEEKTLAANSPKETSEKSGWPPEFFIQTYGSLRDVNLVREPLNDYEIREEM
ncbi:MAG TPA: hypothetical protein PLD25_13830 [Chloroflexota bacterium]|nr:hypothetical protein [Chloroflexota bacterium]